jgi:hypothetical protein
VSFQAVNELLCIKDISLADAVAVKPPAGMLIDRSGWDRWVNY